MKQLTRQQFIRTGTKCAAAAAVGITVFGATDKKQLAASAQFAEWPWQYAAMDVEELRIKGHDAYYMGKGCSYGALHAIFEAQRDLVGEPYTNFPDEIMIYGHGGGAGWGATCGAINGSAAAICLLTTKAVSDKLISELFGWYTQVELPTSTSNQYAVDERYSDNRLSEALPQNVAGSPLCHPSVSLWCETANKKVSDMERKERCARVTGDCVAYAVQLLNDELAGQFTPLYVIPDEVAACNTCHGSSMLHNVESTMACTTCHGDPHSTSGVRQTGDLALNYELAQNYPNPFNPSTTLSFTLPRGEHVFLQIFDNHGRLVDTVINGTHMHPGSYEFTWNAQMTGTGPQPSGTYYARLVAGKFTQTRKMILIK